MNKKYILLGAISLLLSITANAKIDDDGVVNPDSTGFKFTDVKVIKSVPVTNQSNSGTCWCFSGTAFFENEIAEITGKNEMLSEMYTVHKCYQDKAKKYVRMDGSIRFGQGGSLLDVLYVLKNYGAMPKDLYAGNNYGEKKINHSEVFEVLNGYVNGIVKNPNKKLSKAWYTGYNGILDAYFGAEPESFTYKGKNYTPMTYAKSLGLNFNDYVGLASFTHHPFYEKFIMEVEDNWQWGESYNVKMNDLIAIVDNAIDNGHTVLWGADVTEGGFKYRRGYAIMPKEKTDSDRTEKENERWSQLSEKQRNKEKYEVTGPVEEMTITQEKRQEMFDNFETTDDHAMLIVGKAVDQKGNKYYKVQNSWDNNQLYGGFFYVSMPYFLAKTLNIMLNKNYIPKDITKKLGI
jgi:bleomycin hydrolase